MLVSHYNAQNSTLLCITLLLSTLFYLPTSPFHYHPLYTRRLPLFIVPFSPINSAVYPPLLSAPSLHYLACRFPPITAACGHAIPATQSLLSLTKQIVLSSMASAEKQEDKPRPLKLGNLYRAALGNTPNLLIAEHAIWVGVLHHHVQTYEEANNERAFQWFKCMKVRLSVRGR